MTLRATVREMSAGDYETLLRLEGEKRYLERIAYKAYKAQRTTEARKALHMVKASIGDIEARYS